VYRKLNVNNKADLIFYVNGYRVYEVADRHDYCMSHLPFDKCPGRLKKTAGEVA
jgi:hypothetical protein